ncbi:FAD-dependent oxidoreductase, partial [Chryseobacterium sp. SIMBA_028]|uniref:FAD-dependent oxidoreductase n=1 Tax=Chryseobacterium sp. SIMBA_028 TaxID=3085771 RepID=UPI00397D84F5
APRVMPREDEEVSTLMHEQLSGEGVDLRVNSTATRIEVLKGKDSQPMRQLVVSSPEGEESWIEFDELLVAIGREANVERFGL